MFLQMRPKTGMRSKFTGPHYPSLLGLAQGIRRQADSLFLRPCNYDSCGIDFCSHPQTPRVTGENSYCAPGIADPVSCSDSTTGSQLRAQVSYDLQSPPRIESGAEFDRLPLAVP